MSDDWFTRDDVSDAVLDRPGVFAWMISDEDVYVGRATPLRGHWRRYDRHLASMSSGGSYRPDDPDGYRAVHEALKEARERGAEIRYRVLETCAAGDDLASLKRAWVAKQHPRLNGQPRPRRTT